MATATASNPTMALVRSLDDPARWAVKRGVAVFRPHTREFPDGTTVEVSDADLSEIAANTNRQYRESGELVRLTEGHRRTAADYPESLQPANLGFARNYRIEAVERPGGKMLALVHDEYLPRGREGLWAQYPGRSAEYDPPTKTITGVAFLKRDPALPLGTVHYAGGDRLVPLSEAECKAALLLYQRDGVTTWGTVMEEARAIARPDAGPLTEKQMHRALQYQRDHGVDFRVALLHVAPSAPTAPATRRPPSPAWWGSAPPAAGEAMTESEFKSALHYQASQSVDWASAMAHVKGQRRK